MSLSKKVQREITVQIDLVLQKYLDKASGKPKANSGNLFVMALLKDFEPLIHRIHGLKTSLGNEMEKIAEIIARDAWGQTNITRKNNANVELPKNVLGEIDTIINNLSNAKTLSNYKNEKATIIKACKNPSADKEQLTYEFDLILDDPNRKHKYVLEMKGPDPNTTEVPGAKRRLLVALAWMYFQHPSYDIDSQLAIYYNNKFPKPYKNPKVHYYFDPAGGILVQEDFWNFLGRDESTYLSLTKLFESYGRAHKQRIWEGFSKLIKLK